MNKKIIFLSLLFVMLGLSSQSQVKNKPKSIIATTSSMKQYYEKPELDKMLKGELINLYVERVKLLVDTIPYIALATKPGTTMTDIGIPDTTENRKALDVQQEASINFLTSTIEFHSKMLPYADKGTIITSILYYQNMLRELHLINE
jgi:hypothetical protein